MNKQKLFCIIAVMLALLSLLPFSAMADQPGRSNFTWLVAKKLTVWYGGAEFNSDLQMNGNEVYLDADDDTYLSPATDDTIDVYISDAKDFTFSANTLTAQSGSTIAAQAFTATSGDYSSTLNTDGAVTFNSTLDVDGNITSGTGGITMTDYVVIDGAEDAVQLTVQGYTTQTNNALVVEQSDGTDVFTVDDDGNTVISGTLTVADQLQAATITVEAEGVGDVVTVTIQLEDLAGSDIAAAGGLLAYLSDDSDGSSLVATAPDGGIAIGTDGLAIETIANKAMWLVSESDGDIDLIVTESGSKTEYLVLVLPDGSLVVSGAITHAA